MSVQPEVLSFVATLLISLAGEAFIEWHLSGERPMIFANLGILGDLLDTGSGLVVVAGGLSLIVWSVLKLTWYLPILFYIASLVLVRIVSKPLPIRVIVTSAVIPPVCAAGIIALHWLTWFA